MNSSISIRNQSCPNKFCPFYQRILQGNVIVHSQKAGRMKCKACGKTWAAYRHEARYGLRTHPEKIERAVEMLKQEITIRTIAKAICVSPSTVQRWKARMKHYFVF